VPKGKNILRGKFVFDDKRGVDGKIVKFKARFVAMGFTEQKGVDYSETFAGVMITKSFRIMLVIYNSDPNFEMEHWDVKMAFTQAPVEEELFMYQPEGFEKERVKHEKIKMVCKIKKSLYGLKQSARNWQLFLSDIISTVFFSNFLSDRCVFLKKQNEAFCIVATHVDDIFVLFNPQGKKFRDELFFSLTSKFELQNLGEISFALQTKFFRDKQKGFLTISQEHCTLNFLERRGFLGQKGVDTPAVETGPDSSMDQDDLPKTPQEILEVKNFSFQEDIGSLWWLAQISRPDIF